MIRYRTSIQVLPHRCSPDSNPRVDHRLGQLLTELGSEFQETSPQP